MKYTMVELFTEILKRNNMGAYVSQSNGYVTWFWMGGEYNSMVGRNIFKINNIMSMRKAFNEIRNLTIKSWVKPDPLTATQIEKRLNRRKAKWSKPVAFRLV